MTGGARTRVLFSDLLGLSHGKVVPSDQAGHPTHYAMTVMVQGLDLEFVELPGYATEAGYPDMEARVVAGTERPGWRNGSDGTVAIAELYHSDGRPFALDGRQALRRSIEAWTARGLEPRCGFEMEFYLLAGPTPADGPLDVPWHRVYGTGPGADPSGLLEDILSRTEASGLRTHGVNGEFHAGQAEAALHHLPAVEAADAAFLFKELVREAALDRGAGVTFMARPFADRIGNGLHLNLSASRRANDGSGANAFDDPDDPDGISALGRHAVAGLLDHHEAMTAVFAPTVNSYKRLQPRLLSGYWATWGLDNRIATVRIPGQRGGATRIEHRTPDGTANPYLALAAMLAAAMDGIEREADLPDAQTGDGDSRPVSDRHTPHSLAEALDAFEKDLTLRAALGDDLCDAFVAIKRQEVERWNRAVTDWERAEYGRVY